MYIRPNTAGGAIRSTDNSTHAGERFLFGISSRSAISPITGYVFEDVNYGGGAGRPRTAAGASVRSGARVELYDASGTFVGFTTTDATGLYTFTPPALGNYTVRVVNSTVTSSRTGYVAGLLPVQTYNGTTTQVGGEVPNKADAAAGTTGTTLASLNTATTIAQSQADVTVAIGPAAVGADFGFNFDAIVNTNNTGQGSLRQFVLNSNALGGEAGLAQIYTATDGSTTALTTARETSIFMIPNGTAVAGQLAGLTSGFTTSGNGSGTAATIVLSAVLDNITGPGTIIDGTTQTRSTGNSNAATTTSGSESTGPEVNINFGNIKGFTTSAANTGFIGLGLTNALTTGGSTDAAISVLAGATTATIQNNTVYGNGANLRINGVNGATVSGNISRGAISNNSDGLELTNTDNNTISGNQFLNNAGYGIDFISGDSNGNSITGNTFSTNGRNTSDGQSAGIGIRDNSANNTISSNTFTSNVGDGISAKGTGTNNVFSQNSFANNGNLAIDLTTSTNNNGDGVTINDLNDLDGGPNSQLNFPILNTASVNGTNLVVNGFARPGALVELYLATADPTGFGEGTTYLVSRTEGNAADDSNTGAAATYGPLAINGLSQGTDLTNPFTFTIPLSSLTTDQRTAILSGNAVLTSTATLRTNATTGTGTSEFSGNLALTIADVTVSLAGPTTLYPNQATGTYTATFTNEGSATASTVTRTVTLPVGASLSNAQLTAIQNAYAGATYTAGTRVIDFGSVATLANDATSIVSFAFTAPSTVGTGLSLVANTSTTSSEGANLAPNAATLTLNTASVADVTAAITASVSATTGTFNVTFGNNGPSNAAGVIYSVQLPTGLTGVTATNGGTYTSSTGIVAYGAATTLAASGTFASTITYPVAGSPSTPVTAAAFVSTTTDEAGVTANNVASAAMPTAFDLTTTLSGPTSTIAGSPTTLYVTTTNNGPNTAGTATQTVTIPSAAALTNLFITNGGTYSFSGSTGTVTFPTLSNLPSGQTVTNSISFLAPAAAFAPSATVSTASSTETSTTNNSVFLNGAASSTNMTVSGATATNTNEATTITATVGATTTPATVVSPGSTVTYTVTAKNNGPSATTGVVQRVQLLPGLTTTNLTVGGTTGTLSGSTITFGSVATYNTSTGVLTYATLNNQAVGNVNTFATIAVVVPAAIGNDGQLVATASVSTALSDNVPADNVASVGVKVRTAPDVTTTISGPSSTVAGLPTTYVVKFANSGATTAATVTETAQLPGGLSGVVVKDAAGATISGAYNSTTGLITFPSLTSDATGATQYFTVTLPAPAQTFPVTSSIASVTSDGVSSNNSASLNTTITAGADLGVLISGPATAVVGNPVTYVVTTTNNGPSVANTVVASLQLPTGLSGVDAGSAGTYDSGTGIVTYNTATTLSVGGSVVNFVTFTMPNPAAGSIAPVVTVSSAATDIVATNNTASLTTSVAPATTETADVLTSITPASGSVVAGSTVDYIVAYRNNSGSTATNVVPTANLPTGLSVSTLFVEGGLGTQSGDVITVNTGSGPVTYNVTTGLLTFPTLASLPVSTSATLYRVSFPAPVGSGQLVVISNVTSSTSESVLTNNRANSSLTVTTSYDVVTSLAGPTTSPAGATNTYTVTTRNNGPSTASTATTQTVTVPANSVVSNLPSGASYNSGSGVITFSSVANLPAGVANQIVNSFSVTMPASGNLALSATVASVNESNTGNNSATLTTIPLNLAPIAQNVWNTLQTARGNTSTTQLAISRLNATDTDGTISSYSITSLPTSGTLYSSGTQITSVGQALNPTSLTYIPTAGFVGNAFFNYTATDNSGLVSPAALYTIPVAQDQSSTYAIFNGSKGGNANQYATGDVLAQLTDLNTATYSSAGLIYNATTGALQPGAANGLPTTGTNATLVSGTLPSGVSLDPTTGRIFVSDNRLLVNNGTARSYTITVRTIDINGGVNDAPVTFTIGAFPLPVTLTSFTAQAAGQDAKLVWATAQELNNDHFVVERSFDGQTFTAIKQVKGQGTKTTATTYSLVDAQVTAKAQHQVVYYRLRQVDTDGTESLSSVQSISFPATARTAVEVYPNPATSSVDARLDLSGAAQGTYQVTITDMTGRTVRTLSRQGGSNDLLEVQNLPTGSYLLQVKGNGQVYTKRLIKE